MKNKTKKILSLLILLVGIILLVVSTILFLKDKDNNSNNNNTNNTCSDNNCNNNNQNNNNENNIENKKDLEIENLCVTKQEDEIIKVIYNLVNNKEVKINNQKMYINFYNNEKLLYEYEYDIDEMNINETITVDVMLDVKYSEITKYEFVFQDTKKEITLNCS